LRAKLAEITELIDAADQRKIDAKHSTMESLARLEKNEVDVQGSKRRIKILEKELTGSTERADTADGKLKKVSDDSDEIEKSREELESKENDADEAIQKMEEQVKEAKRDLELNETKFIESERKATVVRNDTEKIRLNADEHEKRVAVLEEVIQNNGKSLEDLEAKEGEASEKEELNEEKFKFLEHQLKEDTSRGDTAQRACAVLERNILETENEINSWVKKRDEIEKEMIAMDDVADDPAYKFEGSVARESAGYVSDSGNKLKKIGEMFNKASESESESRPTSRAAAATPAKSPIVSAPASAAESEAEESEAESEAEAESEVEAESEPEAVPEPEPVVAEEPAPSASEAETATEDESEEEESDDYFK